MTRDKFQRKWYFYYEKDSSFNPRLIHKSRFLIEQVPIEKYGLKIQFFAIQHIENRKKFYWSAFPPPPPPPPPPWPSDQTNPFAYSFSFTFHTSYKNGMNGHGGGGGGNAVKMFKNTLV